LDIQSDGDKYPEGSQYKHKQLSYKEYNGYLLPSEDKEPIYIQAMSDDEGSSSSSVSAQCKDTDWMLHQDIIRRTYQHSPNVQGAIWEFTPHDGITHVCGCGLCTNFKDHLIVAEALNIVRPSDASAWKIHDNYKEELIHLRWGLAHESEHLLQPLVPNGIFTLQW
jgi:hypothetical protein